MRRLHPLLPISCALIVVVTGCGLSGGNSVETLPAIRTTTSTTTTTIDPDGDRMFWEVRAGDTLQNIADSFQVPLSEIVKLNDLSNNGNDLDVGQIIEIPRDVVIVTELPSTSTSSTSTTSG